MTVTGLLRILFRWRRPALIAALLSLAAGLAIAWMTPLVYESQSILERKPAKVTTQITPKEGEEFDVYRLTSESQRSVALLKSRHMLSRWFDALGLPAKSPLDKERGLNRLRDTLAVQPVSYTDVLMVKVRAFSPEDAQRRNQTLISLFSTWDLDQDRQEADQLVTLLRERMKQVTHQITQARAQLQAQKSDLSLSLIGSASTRQLEADISAKVSLQDTLTAELESAERRIRNDSDPRTRVLAPPTLPGKPVRSRALMSALAFLFSLLFGGAITALLEWLDPTVRRMQDVARQVPQHPVVVIPELAKGALLNGGAGYLSPLISAVSEAVARKHPIVVQIASASDGDGKSTLSEALATALSQAYSVCLVHRSATMEAPKAMTEAPSLVAVGARALAHVSTLPTDPIEPRLGTLRERYDVIILDTDNPPESAPGSRLLRQADITCLLLAAGRTPRFLVRAMSNHLATSPEQRVFFVLNRFQDPLPPWLRYS